MASKAFPKHPPSARSIAVLSASRTAFFASASSAAGGSAPSPAPSFPARSFARQRPRPRQYHLPSSSRCTTFGSFSTAANNNTASNNSSNNNHETTATPNNNSNNDQLRIAIVGGGAAGMTAALHLSPLVASGLLRPVDVYESTSINKKCKNRNSGHTVKNRGSLHQGGKQLYPGSGALGRDIGVGIWSTAWWPFLKSLEQGKECCGAKAEAKAEDNDRDHHGLRREKNRQSYRTLLQDLEACGSYVEDVGYRTPNGSWLVKSELNGTPFGINDLLGDHENDEDAGEDSSEIIDNDDPALLFVREKDLLSCLRNAIKIEQRLGTVKYHSGVRVDGIENVNGDLGSLVLQPNHHEVSSLSPQYHLIIAADGLYSPLRSRFAGHSSTHATGTGIESSSGSKSKDTLEYKWEHTKGQREATQVEDREYIVFRGNAPILESDEEDGSGSFQTWGEERSMRFAAVPFYHETEDLDDDDDDDSNSSGHYSKSQSFISKKKDEEVWFATISDPAFIDAFKKNNNSNSIDDDDYDAIEQKQLLMKAFGSWHKPVQKLIETTPAEDIMYEMAIAHRHNAQPVYDVARIMEFEMWQQKQKEAEEEGTGRLLDRDDETKIEGRGPILAFIGDSFMTVDPVLAQGFTMAMESGASIVHSIERILVHPEANTKNNNSPTSAPTYQPKLLRKELLDRHYHREQRLLQLLRSTELVQQMAQPHGIGSVFATWIVRPVVKLCPDVIKKRVFDYMIRYSLGLTGGKQ